MTTEALADKVETFVAKRAVNLGYEIRQAGDYIHEYTDPTQIKGSALERLIRMGYIERRIVSRADLEAFTADHQQPPAPAEEVDGDLEGETSQETPENPVDDSTGDPDNYEGAEETQQEENEGETIEDLGPVEEDESTAQPKKKVVRTSGRTSRRK